MHGIWKAIGSFVRRADMILLSLCIAASVFGIVVFQRNNVKGSAQYVRTQILALVLGIILYVFFTLVDVDIIADAARAAADLLGDLHSSAVPLRRYPKRQPFLAGSSASCRFPSNRRSFVKFHSL